VLNGYIMTERILRKSKIYAHKIFNCNTEDTRSKGIQKFNVKNDQHFKSIMNACLIIKICYIPSNTLIQ